MRLIRVLAGLFLFAVFGWGCVLLAIFIFGRRDEARPVDAIVVLGAAQYDGKPSPVLKARLDHAVGLYRRDIAPTLILTGGVGVGDTVSEAAVGRRYVVRRGVPERSILIEPAGLSTEQSMATVKRLMAGGNLDSAVLVSDPFHMLRLRLLAASMGIRAYSSPTRTSPITLDSPTEWRHVVRESLILPFALLRER
ncbi:MAG: YdcF family protein [Gemmatimonadetes bacterium]|nr:YdcF family protein [Gemmatimonadota bacterium]